MATGHSVLSSIPQYLRYPKTIGYSLKHWVEFQAYWATGKQAGSLDTSIALYLPADALTTSYKSSYEAANLGMAAGKGMEMLDKIGGVDDPVAAMEKAAGAQKKGAKGSELAQVAGIVGAGKKSDAFKTVMEQQTGAVVNPYIVAAYKGPTDLREHNFSFKMMPENASESRNCMTIVNAFKKAMLPHHRGGDNATSPSMLFGYPDKFKINFIINGKRLPASDENPMFNIGESVCTAVDLNYATQDVPLFFEGTQYPVTIDMKLTFMELEVMHRHRVDHKGA